jgi:16S rRNA (cytosine967-C5)-methyltransferase
MRIEADDAYANLLLPEVLESSGLSDRDRRFVTELVYGVTRRRRSLDWLLDRYLNQPPPLEARTFLRLGAYQLLVLRTPPHAAVGETVQAAPPKWRGLCNAVLRKVAAELADGAQPAWPSVGVELSYPDWIVDRLVNDLGDEAATAALVTMDEPASATVRDDGYTQDLGSQWVAVAVGALPGERVLDACAAPGGKATAMAAHGARVVAADLRPHRARLVAGNARRVGVTERLSPLVADATAMPFADATFDRVLVDAPCSGLGSLRRRPDARWRISDTDVDELAALQLRLVDEAARVLRPGGVLVYSVCTLTAAETTGVDHAVERIHPHLRALDPIDAAVVDDAGEDAWQPSGRGALLLPQAAGTDGMFLLRLRKAK